MILLVLRKFVFLNSLLVLRNSDTFCLLECTVCVCCAKEKCTASASLTSSTGILNSRSFFSLFSCFCCSNSFSFCCCFCCFDSFVVVVILVILQSRYSFATFSIWNFLFFLFRSFYFIWRKNIYLPFQLFDGPHRNCYFVKIQIKCEYLLIAIGLFIAHCAPLHTQINPIKSIEREREKAAQFSLKRLIKQHLICVPHHFNRSMYSIQCLDDIIYDEPSLMNRFHYTREVKEKTKQHNWRRRLKILFFRFFDFLSGFGVVVHTYSSLII